MVLICRPLIGLHLKFPSRGDVPIGSARGADVTSAAVTPSEAASNPIGYAGPRSIPVQQSVPVDHQRITTHGHDSDATR